MLRLVNKDKGQNNLNFEDKNSLNKKNYETRKK
jgi:hypothetical protein